MFYSKEKQIIVSLITSIIILGIYSLIVYNKYITGYPEIINNFAFWGKAFVIYIPIAIVAQIIIYIIFSIINKIVTNEDVPTLSDERDKLIELKAARISYWTFTFGFLLSMGSQALEMQPYIMFLLLIAAGTISSIAEGIAQIYFYRKGF